MHRSVGTSALRIKIKGTRPRGLARVGGFAVSLILFLGLLLVRPELAFEARIGRQLGCNRLHTPSLTSATVFEMVGLDGPCGTYIEVVAGGPVDRQTRLFAAAPGSESAFSEVGGHAAQSCQAEGNLQEMAFFVPRFSHQAPGWRRTTREKWRSFLFETNVRPMDVKRICQSNGITSLDATEEAPAM